VTDTREPTAPSLEIAHVLFMDIMAYSTLHMDRQHQLLHELQEAVRNTSAFNRAQFEDQLIRLPTGDGMAMVFFRDPEAPVRCALELSKALRNHPDIKLRMGIHSGPVYRVADINANRNVAGGGINIAQRVMDCGDAGHILVSATEAEVLGQVSSWCAMLHDLGEVEVKHGVRLHLYNLYTEEAGSPEVPKKIGAQWAAVSQVASDAKRRKLSPVMIAGIAVLVLATLGGWLFYAHKAHALSSTDTIVLGDFMNKTGDAVFDDTLRQGLAVQLEQSPFLRLVSDQLIQQTLHLMGQPADAKLTPEIARDLCQRAGSKAYLSGSIASLGSQYVLGLKAVSCLTGDTLAEEQERAAGKEQVLSAMDKAAPKLRAKLGESLSTVQKFDTPVEQATTPSLEALQAYSQGRKTLTGKGDDAGAVPLFQRAIHLDPNFAQAYAALGASYGGLGEPSLAAESTRKAYELRARVSEREKFYIESHYYDTVPGDLGKAQQVYDLWAQTYPRDDVPPNNLGIIYWQLGQFDKGLAQLREQLRREPKALLYANVVRAYLHVNRLEEAGSTAEEAQARGFDSPVLRFNLYQLAFLQNDSAEMAQQVAWAASKPGMEDVLLAFGADTVAYSGRLAKARELSRRATASAERAEEKEVAASYEADAALREGLFGNGSAAHERVKATVGLSTGRDAQYGATLALALAGDSVQAWALADDLRRRFPEGTLVQSNYLPTIHAQLALNRSDVSGAIKVLEADSPYALGTTNATFNFLSLYPVYVRGEVYLASHQGTEAAAEFQKILDHRGVVRNEPIGALAHLQIGRAYALQGETAKAKAAYQDFLTLWRDADPDIPILKQAKAEYAKLQ
jgi:class 3 adenylate cyclase/tetratricopeptide (TPR) repeat protein